MCHAECTGVVGNTWDVMLSVPLVLVAIYTLGCVMPSVLVSLVTPGT